MSYYKKVLNELVGISNQFNMLMENQAWDVMEEVALFIQKIGAQIGSNGISSEDDLATIRQMRNDNVVLFGNVIFDNLHLLIEECRQLIILENHSAIVHAFQYSKMNFSLVKNEQGKHQFIYEAEATIEQVRSQLDTDTQAVILIGTGSSDLEKKLRAEFEVLVIEPYQLSGNVFSNDIISFDDSESFTARLKKVLQQYIGLRTKIIMHPHYPASPHCVAVLKQTNEVLQKIRIEVNTRSLFAEEWYKQYVLNANVLNEKRSRIANFDRLKNFHQGERGLMIAGGPSLEEAIPHLKRVQSSYYIVAIGQTVKVLLENGIVPDYIVSTDAGEVNAHFFKGVDVRSPLVYSMQVHHHIPDTSNGMLIPYAENDVTHEILTYSRESLQTAPSVALSAVMFMNYAGFSSIGLVGQDLALREGEYYSQSVKREASSAGQLSDTLYDVELNDGSQGKTTPMLANFLNSYHRLLQLKPELKNKLINYAERGAKINHVDYEPLTQLTQNEIQKRIIAEEDSLLQLSIKPVMSVFTEIDKKVGILEKRFLQYAKQRALSVQDFEKCLKDWNKLIGLKQFKSHVMPLQIVNLLVIQNQVKLYTRIGQTSEDRLRIIKSMHEALESLSGQLGKLKELAVNS